MLPKSKPPPCKTLFPVSQPQPLSDALIALILLLVWVNVICGEPYDETGAGLEGAGALHPAPPVCVPIIIFLIKLKSPSDADENPAITPRLPPFIFMVLVDIYSVYLSRAGKL